MAAPFLFIDSFFTRGDFTTEDAQLTAQALFHFGWGVPAFVLIKVLAPGFFAREDTKTRGVEALRSLRSRIRGYVGTYSIH